VGIKHHTKNPIAWEFEMPKAQLVPLIQAGLKHKGFALIDVLSPCVTFNDHEGSNVGDLP
jgi:2-oxoglutarate/2-oxoacid ferredoxin oxidoreductase subunit beta